MNNISIAILEAFEDEFQDDDAYVSSKKEKLEALGSDKLGSIVFINNLDREMIEAVANNLNVDSTELIRTAKFLRKIW